MGKLIAAVELQDGTVLNANDRGELIAIMGGLAEGDHFVSVWPEKWGAGPIVFHSASPLPQFKRAVWVPDTEQGVTDLTGYTGGWV